MNNKLKIHHHPWTEERLSVPIGHVIIDIELYMELVKRFGDRLPSLYDINYEETTKLLRDKIAKATAVPLHMLKGDPK
jgi:hypothetical protein